MRFDEIVTLGERFELQNGDETVRTTLQEIVSDTEFIVLQPTIQGVPVRAEDHNVTFVFYRPNGCYRFEARISPPFKKDNIMLCRVWLASEVKRIQRRQYYRLPIDLDVFLHELDEIGEPLDKKYRGRTKELSEKSVAVSSFQEFEEDTLLGVEIKLSGTGTVMLKASVLTCRKPLKDTDPYDIVLVFTDYREKDRAFLRRYIFNQQVLLRKKGL